jgi:hypothetical protein
MSKKSLKYTAKVKCSFDIPFRLYATEKLNKKALAQIRTMVKWTLKYDVGCMGLLVEDGIDDATGFPKNIKVEVK